AWAAATPATGFVQLEPVEGAPAPDRTEVRFVYTDNALYIGARMSSAGPVRRIVARRDNEPPSERLIVSLDTRHDRRTAFTFGVTPAGGRFDYFQPSDDEESQDESYNPVWEVATAVDSGGWTAELRIPFTQLRYNPVREQTWGVNLVRVVPDRNEESYWVLVGRTESGWASRMGRLAGIRDLPPARRIELTPYAATNATRAGTLDPGNPFSDRYTADIRAGADLKMGLGPNLTLDATINPDFGQVEADPAEVNLTAFETFFDERRPFFVEGRELFGGRGTFYSRRIGASPPIGGDGDYAESLDNSTILGAAKITGRLPSGLSLGILGAATAEEAVQTYDSGTATYGASVVAPFTGYGIVTARQEFGRERSTITATVTGVERDLEDGSPLAAAVARRAVTALVDGRLRWGRGGYDLSAFVGYSYVAGDSLAILGLQRSSRRYYQRPDADHVEIDARRTTLTGALVGINHSKMSGNWRWNIDYAQESPGLELNDLGALGSADDRFLYADFSYRHTRPAGPFHSWNARLSHASEWNFGGEHTISEFGFSVNTTLRSFWEVSLGLFYAPRAQSDALTRGGPLMMTPRRGLAELELRSRRGAASNWEWEIGFRDDELGGGSFESTFDLSLRLGPRWSVSFEPSFERQRVPRQYVTTQAGRYIFAFLERSEWVAELRASFAVTPDLSIEGYLEPFASSGRYARFGELARPRSFDLTYYDAATLTRNGDSTYTYDDGTTAFSFPVPDFDVRSLRSNFVLRWEWQPGSTLYLVWQQDRSRRGVPRDDVGPDGLWDAVRAPGDHFVALKVSYWIPVR
ncbi:MAG: DUF5916 domain-containing protein, partial [Gemmatimonadales bacterium]